MCEIMLGFTLAVISYLIGYANGHRTKEKKRKNRHGEFVDWI